MNFREYIFKMDIKTKIIGASITLIMVSYLLYIFLITPLLAQQKRLSLSLLSQKKLLEAIMANTTNVDGLKAELKKASEELENIKGKFLTEEKLPTFFAELRDLASDNNVNILNLKVEEKRPIAESLEAKEYEMVPVDISLSGNYLNTTIFLAQLRKKPAVFSISKMFMKTESEKDISVKTNLQLTLYLIQK